MWRYCFKSDIRIKFKVINPVGIVTWLHHYSVRVLVCILKYSMNHILRPQVMHTNPPSPRRARLRPVGSAWFECSVVAAARLLIYMSVWDFYFSVLNATSFRHLDFS